MKKYSKYIILTVIVLIILIAVIWYLLLPPTPRVSVDVIQQAVTEDLLSEKEHELLTEFTTSLKQNNREKATDIVIDNKFQFRSIFHNLVQRGLYLKYLNEPDSAKANMEIASEIAEIYEKNLGDGFLKREFDFCNTLENESLNKKIELDYLYKIGHEEKSLKLSRKIGDSKREVDNLLQIQYKLYSKDLNKQALTLGQENLDIVSRIGYRYREEWILNNIGSSHLELGEYRQALDDFKAALEIAKELDDQYCEMRIYWRMGIAFGELGEMSNALTVYNNAIERCQIDTDRVIKAKIYIERGLIYKKIGFYAKAKADFGEALNLLESHRDQKATALVNLGELYRILGAYDRAVDSLFKAFDLYTKLGRFYDVAATLKIIGDVYQNQHEYQEALNYYQQALKTIELWTEKKGAIRSKELESEIWLSIGDIDVQNKSWEPALDSYKQALNNFKKMEVQEGITHALTRISNLNREIGEYHAALENLKEAQKIAEKIKDPLLLSNANFGIGLVHRDQQQFDLAEIAFTAAIDTIEKTREKILGDEKISYFATIQDIYDEMILLQCRQLNKNLAFNFSERSRARAFFDLLNTSLDSTEIGALPPPIEEIQNTLNKDIQMIEYKVTNEKLIIFIVSKDDIKITERQISHQELRDLIFEFRKTIGADEYNAFRDSLKRNPEMVFNRSLKLAKQLYSITIEPIQNDLSSDKITYIVPEDVLFYLPFAALFSPDDKFLIQDYNIAYAPSAAILKYSLETRKASIPADSTKLLAVANPTLDLPYSEKEVRTIAKMFNIADTLIGSRVSEDTVVKCLNKDYHIIHLATHAIIDERSPLFSYLVLGSIDTLNQDTLLAESSSIFDTRDNRLLTYEIFNLNLSAASLVTLSACETAGGRLFLGEGMIGLTRAFMKAGASSVITTLWDIDDKFTQKIMTTFYEQNLKKGMTKAQALRTAQLDMIEYMWKDRIIKFPHPNYWAAFNLTGDFF